MSLCSGWQCCFISRRCPGLNLAWWTMCVCYFTLSILIHRDRLRIMLPTTELTIYNSVVCCLFTVVSVLGTALLSKQSFLTSFALLVMFFRL